MGSDGIYGLCNLYLNPLPNTLFRPSTAGVRSFEEVCMKTDITSENKERMKELYFGGLYIAMGWLDAAVLRNDGSEKVFQRIFDDALEQYKTLFGE